ncbi:unnamed protein product [Gongylonema pulchrum]|uniref:HD domain-containing protein n=1 Tax=Gongylonema pulchrum TaxID=637853 RepID=A0A183EHS5_9BILA|nr:unnamed protein product [Gongylonema pulchrum]
MEETVLQDAVRHAISYHDIQDVVGLSKHPSTATVQLPETKRAEIILTDRYLTWNLTLKELRGVKTLDKAKGDPPFLNKCVTEK